MNAIYSERDITLCYSENCLGVNFWTTLQNNPKCQTLPKSASWTKELLKSIQNNSLIHKITYVRLLWMLAGTNEKRKFIFLVYSWHFLLFFLGTQWMSQHLSRVKKHVENVSTFVLTNIQKSKKVQSKFIIARQHWEQTYINSYGSVENKAINLPDSTRNTA